MRTLSVVIINDQVTVLQGGNQATYAVHIDRGYTNVQIAQILAIKFLGGLANVKRNSLTVKQLTNNIYLINAA